MSEIMLGVMEMPDDLFWSDDTLSRVQHNAIRKEAAAEIRRLREPTHYAVIDEHGEIVIALKCLSYRDAEKLCQSQITSKTLLGDIAEAKDWTVKGVTVHE